MKINEQNVRKMRGTFKCLNICKMGAQGRKEGKRDRNKIFKVLMTENFPNLMKNSLHSREAECTLG